MRSRSDASPIAALRLPTPIPTLLAVVLLALALAAPAQAGDRQTVRAGLTTARPDTATGVFMNMRFVNPGDRRAKPHSVDKVVIHAAPGTRFDHSAVPRCDASDAELMARGESACPPGSKVQSGRITMDTGSPFGVPRIVHLRTTTFNSRGGFVSLGEVENLPLRGVVRSRVRGNTVVVDYADVPGKPPPDSYSAMKVMRTSGPPIVRGGRPFMRTPPTCPASGRWTTRYTFIYHDGVRQAETTHAPCRPSPTCRGTEATIVGTPGDDAIETTRERDVIVARRGDDTIEGRRGRDLVCSGRGADEVRGGRGRDRLFGGAGRDFLGGGRGRDRLHGGASRDMLVGGRGRDRCRGGKGKDERRGCER